MSDRASVASGSIEAGTSSGTWIVLLLIVLGGASLRLAFLAEPMRQDEADTVMRFALSPARVILVDTAIPNNHILHSLLVKASIVAFGMGEWAVRLPALVAGLLAIPLTFQLGRSMHSAPTGLLGAGLVAASPSMVLFSTNARGYTIVVSAFLAALLAARSAIAGPNIWRWAAFVALVTVAMAVTPSALYATGVACLWTLLQARATQDTATLRTAGAACVAAAVLSALAYLPAAAVSGPGTIVGNEFVRAQSLAEFLHSLPVFGRELLTGWITGWPAIGVGIVAILLGVAITRPREGSVSLAALAVVWSLLLMFLMRRAPFPRVLLFLVPLLAITAGVGATALIGRLRHWRTVYSIAVVPLGAAALLGTGVASSRSPALSRETNRFSAGPAIARYLQSTLAPDDLIVARWSAVGPVDYYLAREGVRARFAAVGDSVTGRLFVIATHALNETMALVLEHRRLAGVDTSRVTEISGFPEASVWLVERPARPDPLPRR